MKVFKNKVECNPVPGHPDHSAVGNMGLSVKTCVGTVGIVREIPNNNFSTKGREDKIN